MRVTAAAKPGTRIGGSDGALWLKTTGHRLMFFSSNRDELNKRIDRRRPNPPDSPKAAASGDVILAVVPYAALPKIGKDPAAEGGKCRVSRADMAEAANESAGSPRRRQRLHRHA